MEASWAEHRGSMNIRNVGILSQHYTASRPEDGCSIDLRNIGILPQHYTGSQPEEGGSMDPETSVPYHSTTRVTTQKTSTWNITTVKVSKLAKGKLSLCLIKYHTVKIYGGIGRISLRIFNVGTSWRWVVIFTLRPLIPWYPLDRRLENYRSTSGNICSILGGHEDHLMSHLL
jgi:hypothetical protein